MNYKYIRKNQKAAIELIALGLLAALIIVLALPVFSDVLAPESASTALISTQKK